MQVYWADLEIYYKCFLSLPAKVMTIPASPMSITFVSFQAKYI